MKSILTNTVKITVAAVLAILCPQTLKLGFTLPVFFLYLLIFILVCQWRKWISAMAMDFFLISHFLSFGKTGPAEIKNEILLFVLGVAFGILVNLLLHKKTDYIEELKKQTDNQIKLALRRMPLKIQNHALEDYDGSCFVSLMKASSPPRTIKKN